MCQMRKSEEPLVVHRSHLVTNRHLQLFGHIAHSSPHEDHHRALAACIRQVPPDWKRPAKRPSHTWLHAIEADLGPPNFGLTTAWRKATTRDEWRHIVDTAVLQWSMLWKKVAQRMLTLRVASNLLTSSIFFVYRAVTVNEFNTTFTQNQLNSRRSCADPWEVCSDASNVGALTTDDKSMEPRRRFHHTWLYAVCLQ